MAGTDKPEIVRERILKQNKGICADKKLFVEMVGKQPKTNTKNKVKQISLTDNKLSLGTQAVAINLKNSGYICIDFDGYSDKDKEETPIEYKTEKRESANKLADEFIKLLDKQTIKYRVDKTASGKRHVWLKQPENIKNKSYEFIKDILTSKGDKASGVVEVFTSNDKTFVHLAGSSIKTDTNNNNSSDDSGADNERSYYTNIYAGADFNELAEIINLKQILITAIENAGYIIRRTGYKNKGSEYYNIDNLYLTGRIRKYKQLNTYHFAYVDGAVDTKILQCSIEDFTPETINKADIDKVYKNALLCVYYSSSKEDDTKELDKSIRNDEITAQLIELYTKYWSNTDNQRHNLILATSHILVNLGFTGSDLDKFFENLADAVNIDVEQHKTIIREGLKEYETAYGVPTIINILQCTYEEINFIFKYDSNGELKAEAENLERIKPTVTKEIKELEAGFRRFFLMQQQNKFIAEPGVEVQTLEIKPTDSITDFIKQVLSNMLLDESNNISILLLELIAVILGVNRCYIVITGVSSGGKSALAETVKLAVPERYIMDIDNQSDKAFERYVQTKGENAYNRKIIDVGDKGDFKGFETQKEKLGTYQSLITKGQYTYQVTNKTNDNINGTMDLTIKTNGFAQLITTTKDAAAYFDEQLATRSTIIYIGNHEFNEITEFQQHLGQKKLNKKVKKLTKLIRGHILFNLNRYDDINLIIVDHWRSYIKDLLIQYKAVNRQVEATIKAFKAYCWLEIENLTKIKGNDNKYYYIPDTDTVTSFIELYGVKTNKITKNEYNIIEWLNEKQGYEILGDTPDYENKDLENATGRKEANLFTYNDLEAQLKARNKKLYNKINNVSELCRKLENAGILGRVPDKAKRNVIYYIINEIDDTNMIDEVDVNIENKHINYALNHLRRVETLEAEGDTIDDILNELGGDRPKFAPDVDFSFIDKRNKKDNDNSNSDNNNKDKDNNNKNISSTNTPGKNKKHDHKNTPPQNNKNVENNPLLKPRKQKKKMTYNKLFTRGATITDEVIKYCRYQRSYKK